MTVHTQETWNDLQKLNKHQLALIIVSDNGRKVLGIDGIALARMFEKKNSRDMLMTHAWKHIVEGGRA